jgi:hypothetical protein
MSSLPRQLALSRYAPPQTRALHSIPYLDAPASVALVDFAGKVWRRVALRRQDRVSVERALAQPQHTGSISRIDARPPARPPARSGRQGSGVTKDASAIGPSQPAAQ